MLLFHVNEVSKLIIREYLLVVLVITVLDPLVLSKISNSWTLALSKSAMYCCLYLSCQFHIRF